MRLAMILAVLTSTLAVGESVPVLVELFTSEGCSSCPPADIVLQQLDARPGLAGVEIIALSEHVDYWDSLGWRDRFSSPLFSARQAEYAMIFRQEGVYTPQVVVNGQAQCLGSDRQAILTAIGEVSKGPRANVELRKGAGDRISVRISNLPKGSGEADMLLAIAESGLASQVERGENGGRRLRHAAVVRSLTRLGRIDPKKSAAFTSEAQINLNPEWDARNVKVVVFVQDLASKRVLGAASLRMWTTFWQGTSGE